MAYNTRKKKVQLILLSRNNIQSFHESVKIHYISKPECITDANGQTLVHLENLNNPSTVMQATNAVNEYYFHTLKHPSHRSKEFWKNFVEHFGHILYIIPFPIPAQTLPAPIILITKNALIICYKV